MIEFAVLDEIKKMMTLSLPSIPAAAAAPLLPARATFKKSTCSPLLTLGFPSKWPWTEPSAQESFDDKLFHRRAALSLSLTGVVMGIFFNHGSAKAASRRAPPPPTEEKKDPNVSGVQAKVLASKKRKEAMKVAIEQLRQKGKSTSSNSD